MIDRVYVHNYRCFENFTLDLKGRGSALIIGRNGSGKSTLRQALGVFQKISRGPNRAKEWIDASDFSQGRRHIPMRFELDLTLTGKKFNYAISFEMPDKFREARVESESLSVDGSAIFSRKLAQVDLPGGTNFGLDWHVAALPVFNERGGEGAIQQLKSFLASALLIAPIPSEMSGFSEEESFGLLENAGNFAAWMNTFLRRYPSAYLIVEKYLKSVIPDFQAIENLPRGESGTQLNIRFAREDPPDSFSVEFKKLSDGEKCFFLSAFIAAHNRVGGPVFCMWDEPDNHLSLPEVGYFITELRKLANQDGQFIATSHHPETIRRFSDESTFVLTRNSHLEPAVIRPLAELPYNGDLINALVRGEVIG